MPLCAIQDDHALVVMSLCATQYDNSLVVSLCAIEYDYSFLVMLLSVM